VKSKIFFVLIVAIIFLISLSSLYPRLEAEFSKVKGRQACFEDTTEFEGYPGHVYSVNVYTGYFTVNVNGAIVVPPSVFGHYLIVVTSGPMNVTTRSLSQILGCVYAIDLQDGKVVWKDVFPNQIMTQPLVIGDVVIVGLGNNQFLNSSIRGTGVNAIVALNATNGQVLWNFTTLGEDMPTPAYYDKEIVEANGNGCVFALNLSGKVVWKYYIGSYVSMSSPLLVEDQIFFGSANPYVFWSFNVTTGKPIWDVNFTLMYPNETIHGLDDSSPAYYDGVVVTGYTVVVNCTEVMNYVVGINATDGNVIWRNFAGYGPLPPNMESPPLVVYRGAAYYDTPSTGCLYAINVSNGAVLWKYHTGPTPSNVDVVDGMVLIQNGTGTLFVLSQHGTLIKEIQLKAMPGAGNLLVTDNSVVVVGVNGEVQAIPINVVL
jgi:outer membrane protein assembly factor BamB